MNKHEELVERLRCFDRVTCNEAADAIEAQAREIEGLRKQDDALIQQLVEALEGSIAITMVKIDQRNAALTAGRARLEGKP